MKIRDFIFCVELKGDLRECPKKSIFMRLSDKLSRAIRVTHDRRVVKECGYYEKVYEKSVERNSKIQ